MRRTGKRKKQISNKTIIIVLFVLFILLGTAYAAFIRGINIGGTATIKQQYSGWGKVSLTTNKYSDGVNNHYQFNFLIENTSTANIQGWQIKMNFLSDSEIGNSSNGRFSVRNGYLIVNNLENNSIITPGQNMQVYLEVISQQSDFELTYLELNGIQMNLSGQTVQATAIYINETNIELFPEQTMDLTVRYEPYNGTGTIVWSSNNTSVATITPDTGVLTAVSPGTCIITATCGNLTDTRNVTVNSNVVQTENLEIKFAKVGNPWSAGGSFFNVQYQIQVKNLTDRQLNNWECDIVLPAGSGLSQQPWGCTITNTTGSTFHIVGPSYYIQPGNTSSDAGAILKVPSTSYIPIPINITP